MIAPTSLSKQTSVYTTPKNLEYISSSLQSGCAKSIPGTSTTIPEFNSPHCGPTSPEFLSPHQKALSDVPSAPGKESKILTHHHDTDIFPTQIRCVLVHRHFESSEKPLCTICRFPQTNATNAWNGRLSISNSPSPTFRIPTSG